MLPVGGAGRPASCGFGIKVNKNKCLQRKEVFSLRVMLRNVSVLFKQWGGV